MNLSEEIYNRRDFVLRKIDTLTNHVLKFEKDENKKKEHINHLDNIKIEINSRVLLAESAVTIKPDKKEKIENAIKERLLEAEAMMITLEMVNNILVENTNKKEVHNNTSNEEDEYEKARKGMNDFWKIYADKKIDIIDKEEELRKKIYKNLIVDLYNGFLLKGYDTMELSINNLYFVEILDEVIKEYPFLTYSKNIVDGRITDVYIYPVKNH